MLIISKDEIKEFYSMKECMEAVKDAFSLFSQGKVDVPLRTQIQNEEGTGTYLCMPAYCKEYDASCVKVINMFPENVQKDIPSINAQVLVMNTETGVIDGMVDGTYVTQLRTGAASGVAFEMLGKENCEIGALIGTGGQAATQLEAMLEAKNLKEVRVADLDIERAEAFVEKMKLELSQYKTEIFAVSSGNEAIDNADLIITVTPSKKPVFDAKKVKAGATISGVGSFQPDMQEIPSELLQRASKIYFDSEEAVLSEAGDLLIPLEKGEVTKEKFTGDIGQVINHTIKGRENNEEIIFFKTVGIAAQDLMTTQSIFNKAKTVGTKTSD
ncbi:ornithine cyclodeaminase [Atopostipes suicloacalis DSM 15692]|uniref:Ornithine cyclodeaminase n=1 Tax=Atopostipes suicloacalis DSM 15692 TaxID=1121025 RepID=A0A1M4UIM3_9LACT|nr:ornithine cyclodeaminase family protein [Atopostipes suicloacalis]SHE56515.1 ornithine cyclodeaminase [Atopostipes suicloacalis DSM 15692]